MLDQALENVIGDVLVSSGFVAYLGPFTVNISRVFSSIIISFLDNQFRLNIEIIWLKNG